MATNHYCSTLDYRFTSARRCEPLSPPPPPPKALVDSLIRRGDPCQATSAARSLSEFIADQLRKVRRRTRRGRRPLSSPPIDPRLWVDAGRFVAWTMTGELVTIEEARPGIGAMPVRLATKDQILRVLAVNRLIPTAVSLYPGDDIRSGRVTRFISDHRLEQALRAALVRAVEEETAQAETLAPAGTTRQEPRAHKRKTRFRPEGNFIIYREAPGLPEFVIDTLGGYVPPALEDRRTAARFIKKHTRRGTLPEGCSVARVLATAKIRPVLRDGFRMPRDLKSFADQVRREPRLVLPNLEVERLPRLQQDELGAWRPQEFKRKRTVRQRLTNMLLDELRRESNKAAGIVESEQIRRVLQPLTKAARSSPIDKTLRQMSRVSWIESQTVQALQEQRAADLEAERRVRAGKDLERQLQASTRVAQRARRRLPESWREEIGLDTALLDWPKVRKQASAAVEHETGHWIRAPFEFGRPGPDRLRSRIVELRIDCLADLLEQFGFEPEFWMVSSEVGGDPKWVLPAASADLKTFSEHA